MNTTVKKLLIFILLISFTGCAPKMQIAYTPSEGNFPKRDICDKNIGILIFDDKRTSKDIDKSLEFPAELIVQSMLSEKFKAHCGEKIQIIEHRSGDLNVEKINYLENNSDINFILIGTLSEFNLKVKDPNSGIRNVGAFISGLTFPVGLVIFPFTLMGDVDLVTEVGLKNIALIDTSGPQVLWRGASEKKEVKEIPFTSASLKTSQTVFNSHSKEVVDATFNNVSLSHDMGFPNKLTNDESLIFLNYVSENFSTVSFPYSKPYNSIDPTKSQLN